MQYLIFLFIYLSSSYFVYRIARKLEDKAPLFAFIPFLSDYQITRLAKKPFYWWIFMYLPVLNFYFDFILWKKIFKRFKKSFIYALMMLIPVINWIPLILLAFVFKIPEVKPAPVEVEEKEEETPRV